MAVPPLREISTLWVSEPVNKWIISEYNEAITKTSSAIESYRFNEAADSLYQFIWHSYCDWYVELIKPQLTHEARETRAVAATILAGALKLLHPFMPYLTEELNRKIFGSFDLIIAAAWPATVVQADGDAVEDLRFVIRLISEIRYLRAEMNVPLSAKPVLHIRAPVAAQHRALKGQMLALLRLARIEGVAGKKFDKGSARSSVDGLEIGLPLAGIIDLEWRRALKEIGAVSAEVKKISASFNSVSRKSPEAVVAENRRRLDEEETRMAALEAALNRLS